MNDFGVLTTEDYLDKDYFLSSDIAKSYSAGKIDKKVRILKIIFAVLCLLLAGEFIYYNLIMPGFSNPKITISGQKNYTMRDIEKILLPLGGANWHNFDVETAASLISSEADIESVTIEKKFPDKIFIDIAEREPVAVIFVFSENNTVAMQIDKNGVIFGGKKRAEIDANKIPIISGLPIEYLTQGMKIPLKYRPLIEQIAKIRDLPQNYFAGISEIYVQPKEFGNYELALIPSQSRVKVLTDRSLDEEALKYMMVVLDVVNQMGTNVSEIDLRYGSVSLRQKID